MKNFKVVIKTDQKHCPLKHRPYLAPVSDTKCTELLDCETGQFLPCSAKNCPYKGEEIMDMETQVLQALARGYCHSENSGKVVDLDLIKAMAKEIIESFSPSRESISSNEKFPELEKIGPMKIALGSFIGDAFGQDTRLAEKLNQVIENQNKIIDYLNQQVKK